MASCSGSNRYYSLPGDDKMSVRPHLYAGVMYNAVHGGFSSGFLHDSNLFVGSSIRHNF